MKYEVKAIQQIQEDEYWFPYHYVAKYKPHFTQCYSDSWGINYASTIEFLLSRISKRKPNSIIDIGCGDGRFTSELSKAISGTKVVEVDYSERAIALAKSMNPSIHFIQADITKSDFKEKYDAGILMEVLEHIPPLEVTNFLRGVSDLLNDNGLLFLTVPHCNKPIEPKHFQHFTLDSLLDYLNEFFEPCEIIPFEKSCTSKKLIDKILINKFFILNNQKFLDVFYEYYKSKLFLASDESDCKRIYVLARKRLKGV